jgi:fido (protein-threonine AMPylation protein)
MTVPSDEELAEMVVFSNAVEKVVEGPGHSLFDDHFEAACAVRDARELLTPKKIHKLLMRRQLPDAGEYRTKQMGVFSKTAPPRQMPRATAVSRLMVELDVMVRAAIEVCTKPDRHPVECAVTARILHAHGLCIHPFSDGNGRTFRLWWNQLRQHFGLPWEWIPFDGHADYHRSIQEYEDRVFKLRYPTVY